jgi:hypothetical protein
VCTAPAYSLNLSLACELSGPGRGVGSWRTGTQPADTRPRDGTDDETAGCDSDSHAHFPDDRDVLLRAIRRLRPGNLGRTPCRLLGIAHQWGQAVVNAEPGEAGAGQNLEEWCEVRRLITLAAVYDYGGPGAAYPEAHRHRVSRPRDT